MATIGVQPRVRAEGGTYRNTWLNLGDGDTGESISIPGASDRSVQVFGDFDTGTCLLEGSLEATPTTWFPLTDLQGNAISFTSDGGELVTEVTTHIRPRIDGGGGSVALTCILLSRRTR